MDQLKIITRYVLPGPVVSILEGLKRSRTIREWRKIGSPLPPPHEFKQDVILEYARKYKARILIESGTFKGDTAFAQRHNFKRIYSIELDPQLYEKALARFRDSPHIQILQGNSGDLIPSLMPAISEPCAFWLDGHYSGGETARGESDTPVMKELEGIISHPYRHVILIDDARLFTGNGGYPTVDELQQFAERGQFAYTVSVEDDIIRLEPQ